MKENFGTQPDSAFSPKKYNTIFTSKHLAIIVVVSSLEQNSTLVPMWKYNLVAVLSEELDIIMARLRHNGRPSKCLYTDNTPNVHI